MIPTKDSKSTHGCLAAFPEDKSPDGIRREITISRFDPIFYQIEIRSFWDGPEKEPIKTYFQLGSEMFELLVDTLNTFSLNLSSFKQDKNEN